MFSRGIAVIGLGYIGLPTSAALAMQGERVVGVDIDPRVVDAVNQGTVPIVEPDLDVAVAGAHARGLLTASSEVPEADVFIIAVPTPFRADKQPDLSFVRTAAEGIAQRLTGGEVVILESTSPPGTTELVSRWIAESRPDLRMPHEHPESQDVFVAHCPERVLPGRIMIELVTNDRVVGGLSSRCATAAREVYSLFCKGEIFLTDAKSAEMAKLVENSFRDVNIAFANELAKICEHLETDVWEIIRLANRHPRVNVLQPGPGVGGHCIAVDPWFIVSSAPDQARLIRQAREINDSRPTDIVHRVAEELGGSDEPIACLGLAFKADIDDLRESPAVAVVQELAEHYPGRHLAIVEPNVATLPDRLRHYDNVHLISLRDALRECRAILLLVDHKEFRALSLGDLRDKLIIDTRGIWSTKTV